MNQKDGVVYCKGEGDDRLRGVMDLMLEGSDTAIASANSRSGCVPKYVLVNIKIILEPK